MNIHEAFNNLVGERLAGLKPSTKYTKLLKQANDKEDLLCQMLSGAEGEIFLELQEINKQIYANDEFDAYKAGFLDALTLFNM